MIDLKEELDSLAARIVQDAKAETVSLSQRVDALKVVGAYYRQSQELAQKRTKKDAEDDEEALETPLSFAEFTKSLNSSEEAA